MIKGMDLNKLYKSLGDRINIRETICKEIKAFESKPGKRTKSQEDRIRALEEEYKQVQNMIIDIDKKITIEEKAKAASRLNQIQW